MNKNKIMEKIKKWNSYSFTLNKNGKKQVIININGDFYLSFLKFCDEYDEEVIDIAVLKKIDNEYEVWKKLGEVISVKDAYKTLLYARKEIGQV